MRTLACLLLLALASSTASADPAIAEVAARGDCAAAPLPLLADLGLEAIYVDLGGPPPPCLGPRLAAALELALKLPALEALARSRGAGCDVRCWLDRPDSAVARVGHRRDLIWPPPPEGLAGPGDVVFFVCSADLGEVWTWIAVGMPEDGRIAVRAVSDW